MSWLYGVVERARVDSRWIKTTFFLSVLAVSCRRVPRGASGGMASAVRFLIRAWSTSDMTTLTTASLEKDLLSPPASTGNERKMSPSDATHAPRAKNLDVAGEPNGLRPPPRLPKARREISKGPSTM